MTTHTSPTTTVAICGPLSSGQFDVHAVGCADLGKAKYRGYRPDAWTATVESAQQIVEEVYSDFIDGPDAWEHFESEIHVLPCVKLPRTI